jgi:hypothetical protein
MNYTLNTINHLSIFLDKLDKREPFAVIRPGDGEYLIMSGKHFDTQDNWKFNGGVLQLDLLQVKNLIKGLHNFFVGIPCPDCQGVERVQWYKDTWELSNDQITYANIFCNNNWKPFTQYLIDSQIPLYYIGPGMEKSSINIVDRFITDPLLVEKWDINKTEFMKLLFEWVETIISKIVVGTFVFSIGPITKYVIPLLYEKYPTCQFIDVGSALDLFTKGSTNRLYIDDSQTYTNIVCDFNRGHKMYTIQDIEIFEGGWSYTPNEITEFLKYLNYRNTYNILEFGAGSSTKILYNIIERYCLNLKYDTYETDEEYRVIHKNVNTIMYNIDDIDTITIPNIKYDIIFIDGPHGVLRAKWYNKIKNNVKYDTIILIDDYNHYKEFENELNKNFEYTILSKSDVPFVPNGEHSWRIITNIIPK